MAHKPINFKQCGGKCKTYVCGFRAYDTHVGEKTLEREQVAIDKENKVINFRLALASQRGTGYPGPKDAAVTMKQIEQVRCQAAKYRIERELAQCQHIARETKKMIKNLSKSFAMGPKVDCWFDYYNYRYSKKGGSEHQEWMKEREAYMLEKAKNDMACYKQALRSKYSKESTEPDWRHSVKKMHYFTRHPTAAWQHDYMDNVASIPPLRKPPPHYEAPTLDRVGDEAKRKLNSCLVQTIYR